VQKTGLWRRKHIEWRIWRGSEVYSWKNNHSHFTYIVQPIIWTLLSTMQCLEYAKCRIFSTFQEQYAFFGHSICLWDLMASITGESAVTHKKLNPTCWAGRLSSLMGIKHRLWNENIRSHCFGEQSVVMHYSSRSCCRRFWVCVQCVDSCFANKSTIIDQRCISLSAVERCWS